MIFCFVSLNSFHMSFTHKIQHKRKRNEMKNITKKKTDINIHIHIYLDFTSSVDLIILTITKKKTTHNTCASFLDIFAFHFFFVQNIHIPNKKQKQK